MFIVCAGECDELSTVLSQEAQSVACALRIALKAVCDDTRHVDWAEKLACTVVNDSLKYYLSLNDRRRRTSWDHVLLLVFAKLYKLPDDKVPQQITTD